MKPFEGLNHPESWFEDSLSEQSSIDDDLNTSVHLHTFDRPVSING